MKRAVLRYGRQTTDAQSLLCPHQGQQAAALSSGTQMLVPSAGTPMLVSKHRYSDCWQANNSQAANKCVFAMLKT